MRKAVIKSLLEKIKDGGLSVEFWDGEVVNYGCEPPLAKLSFRQAPSLDFSLDAPMTALGEAYMDGVLDYEGKLDEIMRIFYLNQNLIEIGTANPWASLAKTVQKISLKQRQKENIRHHYDLGDDFYALWLDDTMSYSCAYFKSPDDSLEQAQKQKIDLILRKLDLKEGETLLDIGSGWGWLMIEAARRYKVKVLGITLSENQYTATKQRIEEFGLTDLAEVKMMDYLDLGKNGEHFNKVVSVGMFEHVGQENLPRYMSVIDKILVPGGLSLLHTITAPKEGPVNSWMLKYIFPGGYIPSLREIISLLPDFDFRLLHAESLRLHYARTLDHWYKNFQQQLDFFTKEYGKRFVRMWDLYLQGCAANFRVSGIDVYQLLFSKGPNNNLPLTLEHIYR